MGFRFAASHKAPLNMRYLMRFGIKRYSPYHKWVSATRLPTKLRFENKNRYKNALSKLSIFIAVFIYS